MICKSCEPVFYSKLNKENISYFIKKKLAHFEFNGRNTSQDSLNGANKRLEN